MYQKLVPVNVQRHAAIRVKEINRYHFAARSHLVNITIHEFARVAATYPIVFIENKEKMFFQPVALLGLNEGENLFVGEHGEWNAPYIPATVRQYPFKLLPKSQGNKTEYVVCLDESSDLLSTSEGVSLFAERGEPTRIIENVKQFLLELQQLMAMTEQFVHFLVSHDLLISMDMHVREGKGIKSIAGCYIISEKRLNHVAMDILAEMRDRQYLSAIYAQLFSLMQIENLSAML
ncbi:MAG: SapC family protein [Magnetococcales bacterium]|nr:SapC family protein [Magnetococcales bacterium]